MPEIIVGMDGSEAPWVRRHYLDSLGIVMGQQMFSRYAQQNLQHVLHSLTRIPEGREWAAANKELIVYVARNDGASLLTLKTLGISDAELTKLLSPKEEASKP